VSSPVSLVQPVWETVGGTTTLPGPNAVYEGEFALESAGTLVDVLENLGHSVRCRVEVYVDD
jgi:hypothetical protein